MARPSDYTEETADKICQLMAGGESLTAVCSAEDMPHKSTVFRWLAKHEAFRDRYARACEARAEHWADEILEIADDGSHDTFTDADGHERVDHEVVARSRLRVDSRKWLMSKLAPKKYGDKLDLTHAGEGGGPIKIERIERVIVKAPDTNSGGV